jgi:uncharacterized protein (TIGR02145 family)
MKKPFLKAILISCFCLLTSDFILFAQAPQRLSYQAEIRNTSNALIVNSLVGMQFSILQGSATGTVVYSERHTPTTNANGLVSLQIGGGTVLSGTFAGISWATGPYFLKTETDPVGGSNYTISGTQQMLSVPYALHSNNGVPAGGSNGQLLTNCAGIPTWTTNGVCPGTVTALNCSTATNTGSLASGVAASGVSSSVPYTGGNGGPYSAQSVTSTGVTGLTASLTAGSFASGAGSLTYNITGTPASGGTANFALNIGGQSCTLTITVAAPIGTITALTCASSTNSGTLTLAVPASGVSSTVPYTGGNGGTHSGQSVTSTGVTGLTATLAAGNFAIGAGSLSYTITGTPATSGTASFALNIGGKTCTLTRTVALPVGTITALNCSTATNAGTLGQGVAAASVSSTVPYTGGNGGTHTGQTVTSTGVTGLTATRAAGNFATGSGTLVYTITGTPATSGTASFALNMGGQTCTLNRTVLASATITALNCSTATNNGTLAQGIAASSVNSSVPYTGGNGGYRGAQTFTSTGVTGLTATCAAGTLATGAGSLTFTITGTPASAGTASFAISIGGQTCTLNRTVLPIASITALSCSTATNNGTFTQGIAAASVNSSVPYTGGNGGYRSAQTFTSTGVTGLTATCAAGTLATGTGNLTFTITGTPASSGTASFTLNIGGQTCTLTRTVNPPAGTITALSCSTATNTGTLTQGTAASSVSSSIPYTGGNGGTYNAQSITSTGVTGLTATLAAGTLLSGAGSLTYTITGTPASAGTASFALSLGGQTCTLTRSVNPPAVTDIDGNVYQTVTIGTQVWMSENLKVSKYRNGNSIPTNLTDADWSATTTGAYAIYGNDAANNTIYGKLYNWYAVADSRNLCPVGWHVPSDAEWKTLEISLGMSAPDADLTGGRGAAQNVGGKLKSTSPLWTSPNSGVTNESGFSGLSGGFRRDFGIYASIGIVCYLWSSSEYSTSESWLRGLYNDVVYVDRGKASKRNGLSVRCLRDAIETSSMSSLNCGGAVNSGTLTQGIAAAGISSSIPYTGGNGGTYNAQTITSTGVTGLTATLAAGTLLSGAGSLTYTITGTPTTSGTASFALNIGGQTCTLTRTVALPVGTITALSCSTATSSGTLTQGTSAASVSSSVPYTGGNGGTYNAQTITSTGVTGLTATLAAGTLLSGAGSLSYTITGTPTTSGTASFALSLGGQTCTLTRTVALPAGTITALSCSTANNSGTLTQGIAAASVSSTVPYTGGNGGTYTAQTITSTGVTGLTATLAAGALLSGAGSVSYTITGTPASSGTASFALSLGGQTCTLTRTVNSPAGIITALSCSTATNTGTLTQGVAAASVSSSVPYTGGNGGTYTAQTITSTGVTGLTATLAAGTLLSGAGSLTFTITGTPTNAGTASFAISLGGQTCTLTRTVNPPTGNNPTDVDGNTYTTVTIGSQVWIKENLKVSKYRNGDPIPTNLDNTSWQNSTTGAYAIYNNDPANNTTYGKLYNWYAVADSRNLCPTGWHVPTDGEWKTLEISLGMSAADADWSGGRGEIQNVGGKLKSTSALWAAPNTGATNESGFSGLPGGLRGSDGSYSDIGKVGVWWSSTEYSAPTTAWYRFLFSDYGYSYRFGTGFKRDGLSVRCLKD